MVLALITLLSACNKSSSYQVTHLPFKADEESRWGLIDFKGNPLIEDEFDLPPSPVVEDRFYVQNSDGLYEFYTAEKKFKKIGGEYISVGIFHDGLAPVVEKDQPISYIRPDGSVAFTLDRYNDELIVQATVFQEGRAAFATKSGKWGYIDQTGKVVIEPKYDFASLFVDKKAIVCNYPEAGVIEMSLINWKGNEQFKLKGDDQIQFLPWKGTVVYSEKKDGSDCYGLLDEKGEKVLKASTKYGELENSFHNSLLFKDSHSKCGSIDRSGNVLIRAKYDDLIPTENVLIFKENDKYGLLSYEGEKICSAIYENIIPFADNQDYTYAQDGNDWILIDQKGTDVRKGEYYMIKYEPYFGIHKLWRVQSSGLVSLYKNCLTVQSDYLDVQAEVDDMLSVIHTDGSLDKLSYNTKSNEFAQLYDKEYKVNDLKDKDRMETLTKNIDLYKMWVTASFNGTVITPNYKRVWKDSYWGRGHWENEIEDYSYNGDAKIEKFMLDISLQGKFIKRKEDVHQAIHNWFEARGYTLASKETSDDVQSSYWIKNSPSVHVGIHFDNSNNYIRLVTGK